MKNFIRSKAFPFIAGGIVLAIIGGVTIGLKLAEETRVRENPGVETGVETAVENDVPEEIVIKEESETEAVAYEALKIYDNAIEADKESVEQIGVDGERTIVYQVTYTGKVESSRTIASSIVTKLPIDEIIKVGTKGNADVGNMPVIEKRPETNTEEIIFGSTRQNDGSMAKGTEFVYQKGVYGIRTTVYSVTYTDNKETGRIVVSNIITKQPVNEIVRVGTRVDVKAIITTKEKVETENIAYKTIRENDSTLAKGVEVISIKGKNGIRTITYIITYTDGKETAKRVLSDVISSVATNEVIKIGTKEPIPVVEPPIDEPTTPIGSHLESVQAGLPSGYTAKQGSNSIDVYKGTVLMAYVTVNGINTFKGLSWTDYNAVISGAANLGISKSNATAALKQLIEANYEGVTVENIRAYAVGNIILLDKI